MSIESNIDWLYSRQRERTAAQSQAAPSAAVKKNPSATDTALKIIEEYKRGRAIAEGVKHQVIKDIGDQPPEFLILLLCEALDRISGGGDGYFDQVQSVMRSKGIPSEHMRADRRLDDSLQA